jgi:1,4-dihydroxy-2-naphthoyl-CoA synthase
MPAYYVQAKFGLVGDDVMIEIVQGRLNRPDVRNGFVPGRVSAHRRASRNARSDHTRVAAVSFG